MNKKGQKVIFGIYLFIGAMLLLVLLALVTPLKEVFTPVLGVNGLNCAVPTDGYRGSCVVIKGAVLIFVGGIGFYIISGLINKARGV